MTLSNIQAVAGSHDFGIHRCGSDIFACRLARFHTYRALYCRNDGISWLLYPWCNSFLVSTSRAVYHTIRPTTTTGAADHSLFLLPCLYGTTEVLRCH